jgi:hypothetical protein
MKNVYYVEKFKKMNILKIIILYTVFIAKMFIVVNA